MAEAIPVIESDVRLEQISEQIVKFANADFQSELQLSGKGDELDAIILGLNLLGEELKSYIDRIRERENQLSEAIFQLNEAQHLAKIGSWEWDIVSDRISWSDELFNLFGLDPQQFRATYQAYLDLLPEDDRDLVNTFIQRAFEEHQPFNFYHRILRHDGSVRIIHSRGDIYTNEKKEPVRMRGTAQDVTELMEAEKKWRTLAAIIESTGDAVIGNTREGIVTSWNHQAERLFGYEEEEVLNRHVSFLFPEDRKDQEGLVLEQVRQGKTIAGYETERRRKDGSLVPVSLTISPILDHNNNMIGVSKIARDITDKKLAEEKLRKYTSELEYKNKETQQFSYVASHDLQEPLRTITNYINLFADDYGGKLDENADVYIRFIRNAASRMQVLIYDLLEFTRIENDAVQVEIDCNALLNEILSDLQSSLQSNNAVVHVGELPVIMGYRTRMTSLFQNLISNAIKFRRKDEDPVIWVNCKNRGKEWLFEIRDNGIGIEKQYHEKIFMMFQRLHPRNEYEGTGIGLAHCKKIVELRGGKIWVESEVEKGSTFYFTLPKMIF